MVFSGPPIGPRLTRFFFSGGPSFFFPPFPYGKFSLFFARPPKKPPTAEPFSPPPSFRLFREDDSIWGASSPFLFFLRDWLSQLPRRPCPPSGDGGVPFAAFSPAIPRSPARRGAMERPFDKDQGALSEGWTPFSSPLVQTRSRAPFWLRILRAPPRPLISFFSPPPCRGFLVFFFFFSFIPDQDPGSVSFLPWGRLLE